MKQRSKWSFHNITKILGVPRSRNGEMRFWENTRTLMANKYRLINYYSFSFKFKMFWCFGIPLEWTACKQLRGRAATKTTSIRWIQGWELTPSERYPVYLTGKETKRIRKASLHPKRTARLWISSERILEPPPGIIVAACIWRSAFDQSQRLWYWKRRLACSGIRCEIISACCNYRAILIYALNRTGTTIVALSPSRCQ